MKRKLPHFRFPGFKILDRYILGKFLSTYFFAIAMIIVVVVIFDYVEKIDNFTETKAPLKAIIFDYYLNFIPFFINQFSGLFTFIAVIFFTSKMAYQTEIVAMLSGGMSFRRLMWPYFLGALIIASLSLGLNLWLIPVSQRSCVAFENQYIPRKARFQYDKNIYRQIEPGTFAYIRNYSKESNQASFFSLEEYESGAMTASLEAAEVRFNPETKRWSARRYTTRTFDSLGVETFTQHRNLDTLINLDVNELGRTDQLIKTMNIVELNQFLEQQRSKGSDSINIIQVEQHARYAYPVGTFILTLIGVSLSSRKGAGRHGTPHRHRHCPLLLVYPLHPLLRGVCQERYAAALDRCLDTEHTLPLYRCLSLSQSTEIMSPQLEDIVRKVRSDERIAPAEALVLWHEAPLWLLGELAARRKERVSGDKVYFNRNFHIEPTNLCVFNCNFCSYRRPKGSPEAWDYSLEEVERIARDHAGQGVTEVHIVGGVHPEHDLYYYVEMIRRVKAILPEATVKAFTAIELSYMIRKAGLTIDEGLRLLRSAGMEAIPGGGAEIFDEELRARICPDKGSTAEWFEVHAAAHRLGIPTNATILYGHIECVEHRIDHLDRLRSQQDLTGGFNAFIPLKYRNFGNRMSEIGEVSVTEDLRMLAISRIYLDNIPHIKAYWVMYGKATTELALAFGADDIDGTIDDTTKIYSMAGADDQRPAMTTEEMRRIVAAAGYRAVERDTFYREIG